MNTGSHPMAYEGVLTKIKRLYLSKDPESLKPRIRDALAGAADRRALPGLRRQPPERSGPLLPDRPPHHRRRLRAAGR